MAAAHRGVGQPVPTQSAHRDENSEVRRTQSTECGGKRARESRNIIAVWLIALRARASPVPNVESGSLSHSELRLDQSKEEFRANCPAPECGREFEFEATETHVFELPVPLFERRHFLRSELRFSCHRRIESSKGEYRVH